MRAFVAVFPPPEVQEELHRAALALPSSEAFRLTAPEKFHLTLKFLGEVPEEALPRTRNFLSPACEGREPFEVETSGFGVFPSERRARILWAGVGEARGSCATWPATLRAPLRPSVSSGRRGLIYPI